MKENITKDGIEVKPGQVWRDLDKRMNDRKCRVVSVSLGRAKMQSIYSDQVQSSHVSVRRMHKSSTGWALVSDQT